MSWNNFNDADDQNTYDLIPSGTLVKVCMNIKPGGYNDIEKGWTGGYATKNENSGAVYLNVEFVVLEGPYARRKIWSLIGLHSEKSDQWANVGRSMIKGILNSANGISSKDNSISAQKTRIISGLSDLNGLEFVAKIELEEGIQGNAKNIIRMAITCDHKEYSSIMKGSPSSYKSNAEFHQKQTIPKPAWL